MNKNEINWKESYLSLVKEIKKDIPKFQVKDKKASFFMKILSIVLFFSKGFMESATTTIYPVVYFPSKSFVTYDFERAFRILSHEYIHLLDRKNEGVLFNFKYLFPQILTLFSFFAILSIWNIWFLCFLAFFAFLPPWPAYFREKYEFRGYLMNLYHDKSFNWDISRSRVEELIDWSFTSWRYYRMTPKSKKNLLTNDFMFSLSLRPEILKKVQDCLVKN